MYKKSEITLLLCSLFFCNLAISLNITDGHKKSISHQDGFLENKGQIVDQNGKKRNDVAYSASYNGIKVFFKNNGFSYEVYKPIAKHNNDLGSIWDQVSDKIKNTQVQYHRIDIELSGSNQNSTIVAEQASSDYINFYSENKQIHNVKHFKKLTYQEIYPNIDLVYHFTEQGIKYDFVIHPGGDLSSIKLKYNGMNSLKLSSKGDVLLATALGDIRENIPESYTINTDNSKNKVAIGFNQDGNTIGFVSSAYDRNQTLVIDPIILWSTYYGDLNKDECYGIAKYSDSSIVVSGYTSSINNIASSGAFQGAYGGGLYDAFVIRFNNLGVRKWATYYGAEGENVGTDVATDGQGNIILVGFTETSTGIPTSGAHQPVFGGGVYDGFVTKFDSLGTRLWSTFYGGNDMDIATTVAADSAGNIVVGGYSASAAAIATSGSHQPVFGGGSSDGFVVNLNSNGVRQWGTYYGGTDSDEILGIVTDKLMQSVAVTGFTKSALSIATAAAHQPALAGDQDAFVAVMDGAGLVSWATYYGGTDIDQGQDIDLNGCSYAISGFTKSTTGIATAGVHQDSLTGLEDAFVVKFDTAGVRQWGTYFGGADIDKGYGIKLSPKSGYVAITGFTKSITGIATSGANQVTLGGGEDVFLADFNPSGMLRTASYIGGFQNDRGFGLAGNNTFYISGVTESSDSVSSSNGFQFAYGGGIADGFVTRIVVKPRPLIAGPCSGNGGVNVAYQEICENDCINFTGPKYDDEPNTNTFVWGFPGGSPASSGSQDAQSCYPNQGIFSVTLNVFNAAGSDAYGWPNVITVNPLPVVTIMENDTTICPANSVSLNATGAVFYTWQPPAGLDNSFVSNPVATPLSTTTYMVIGTDTNQCSNSDIITITVMPSVDAGADVITCSGFDVQLNATNAVSYSWSPSTWLSDPTSANPVSSPQSSITYYVTGTDSLGCQTIDSVHITVNQIPVINAGPDVAVCPGASVQLNATGGDFYIWTPFTGLDNWFVSNPVATVSNNTTYTVIGTDNNGCTNVDVVTITVLPQPTISATADTSVCAGQAVQLNANGTVISYSWSPSAGLNDTTVSNPVATVNSTETYIVTGTDNNGCTATESVTINILSAPMVSAGSDTTVCNGATVQLNASGGSSYAWGPSTGLSDSTIANPIVSISSSITYWVTATGSNGCSATDSITITTSGDSAWSIDFTSVIDYCNSQITFISNMTDSVSLFWQFGDGQTSIDINPTHIYGEFNATYSVTLIANTTLGCYYSDTVTYTLPLDDASFITGLVLPNIFSPNGDGINEVFQVNGIDCLPYYFEIFDRWGAKMFESDKTSFAWNGTTKSGKQAANGTYYYLLHLGEKESAKEVKGFVQLVR